MIEQIFDFLSEFEGLWMGMAYFAAWSIGISILLICVMIFIRVIESFVGFVRNHAGFVSKSCKNATKRVLDKIGERIGESVKAVIADFKAPAPEDMRPKMVGRWESPNGDRMDIEQHDGYFILKLKECKTNPTMSYESFVLRYPQGWLCDDNVYFAEGREYFSLAVSDSCEEIYVSELNQTFKRYELIDFDEIERTVKECRNLTVEFMKPTEADVCFKDIEDSDLSDTIKVNIIE